MALGEQPPPLNLCHPGWPAGVPWAWAVSVTREGEKKALAHGPVAQGPPSLSLVLLCQAALLPHAAGHSSVPLCVLARGQTQGEGARGSWCLLSLSCTWHSSELFLSVNSLKLHLNPTNWVL